MRRRVCALTLLLGALLGGGCAVGDGCEAESGSTLRRAWVDEDGDGFFERGHVSRDVSDHRRRRRIES